jgi:hypothetical protein
MWPFKKSETPVVNVWSPSLGHINGYDISVGLDKTNNKLYYCYMKPFNVKTFKGRESDLKRDIGYDSIHSIKKKKNGGIVFCVINSIGDARYCSYEPLETGECYYSANNINVFCTPNPEKKPFEKQGHPEFDLLECLFTP